MFAAAFAGDSEFLVDGVVDVFVPTGGISRSMRSSKCSVEIELRFRRELPIALNDKLLPPG